MALRVVAFQRTILAIGQHCGQDHASVPRVGEFVAYLPPCLRIPRDDEHPFFQPHVRGRHRSWGVGSALDRLRTLPVAPLRGGTHPPTLRVDSPGPRPAENRTRMNAERSKTRHTAERCDEKERIENVPFLPRQGLPVAHVSTCLVRPSANVAGSPAAISPHEKVSLPAPRERGEGVGLLSRDSKRPGLGKRESRSRDRSSACLQT